MYKEIIISILPWWWIICAILDAICAGAYAMGWKNEHEGISWSIVETISAIAHMILALIFILSI